MPKRKTVESGVVLLIVLSIILVVVILAAAMLRAVTSQSRLTHHQVSRIKAYYAAKGVMNYTLDMLRKGTWTAASSTRYACLGNCSSMGVSSPTWSIPGDSDIPYNILATIYPLNGALGGAVTRLDITTSYTYTP